MVDWHVPNWSLIKKTKWVEMTVEFARTVKARSLINRIREMVSLIPAEKYRDDDFRLVTSVEQRKSSHEKSNLRSSELRISQTSCILQDQQCHARGKTKNIFPYFFTGLKTLLFYLQTSRYWHCWSWSKWNEILRADLVGALHNSSSHKSKHAPFP